MLPNARRARRVSPYAARLVGPSVRRDLLDAGAPAPVTPPRAVPRRRGDESVLPTTFSQMRYYLRCPKDYQLRVVFGFSPPITEMFGFGQTVHAAVGKLHETYPQRPPTRAEAEAVADGTFHLKHVPPSRDPVNRPGGYEQAQRAARRIVAAYADDYGADFEHERQVERAFEVPVKDAVISGAIDLLLQLDEAGEVLGASVIDFKTMEGGPDPEHNPKLSWDELSLQVQLYAHGATQILGENARTGAVHLLKDGQRVTVPVDDAAVNAAVANIEWGVEHIIVGEFPARPSRSKCEGCDFAKLCPRRLVQFASGSMPPPLHLPGGTEMMIGAFGDVES
jgi:DNA helicase II / ATP-dependent DNA helicase PcrA